MMFDVIFQNRHLTATDTGADIAHHKHVHELYCELFKNVECVDIQSNPSANYDSNFWLTNIVFKKSIDTESFCLELDKAGIEARPLWKPMHLQPVYQNSPSFTNGYSEYLFKHGICLPSGPYVKDDDMKYIVDSIKAAIVG